MQQSRGNGGRRLKPSMQLAVGAGILVCGLATVLTVVSMTLQSKAAPAATGTHHTQPRRKDAPSSPPSTKHSTEGRRTPRQPSTATDDAAPDPTTTEETSAQRKRSRRNRRLPKAVKGRRTPVSGIVFVEPPKRRLDKRDPTTWFDPSAPQERVHGGTFAAELPTALLEQFAMVQSTPICTFVWVRHEPAPAFVGSSSAGAAATAVERSPVHERTLASALRAFDMPGGETACGGAKARNVFVFVLRSAQASLNGLHVAGSKALLDLLRGKLGPHTPQAALLLDASLAPHTSAEIFMHSISTAFIDAEHVAVGCPLVAVDENSTATILHAGFDLRVHQRAGGAALVPLHQSMVLEDLPVDASPDALPPTCVALRAADAADVASQPSLAEVGVGADVVDAAGLFATAAALIAGLRAGEQEGRGAASLLPRLHGIPELACPVGRLQMALNDAARAIADFGSISDTSARFFGSQPGGKAPRFDDHHGQLLHHCTMLQHRDLSLVPVGAIPPLVSFNDGTVGLPGSIEDDPEYIRKRDALFAAVEPATLASRGVFINAEIARLLQLISLQVGNYASMRENLHFDALTEACAVCADACNTDGEAPNVKEMVDLCRGSQQGLATLIVHVRAVTETIAAAAHKLSQVSAQTRGLCATTDGRGWVRMSRALQDAGVATVLPMSTSVVVAAVADVFKHHHQDIHAVSLVRQPGWLPVTLGAGDAVGAVYEAEVRAGFVTLGARVHWAVPCSCCGFTVEAAWLLQGLRDKLEVMLASDPRCFCRQRTERSGAIIVADGLWELYASPIAVRRQTFLASRPDPDDVVEVAVHHWDPVMEDTLRLSFDSAVPDSRSLGTGYAVVAAAPDVRILRSMYEFTRIPTSWNEKLLSERFDEIWVPGEVVRQAYIRSGIPESSLYIVPEAVDVDLYSPDSPAPRMEFPIPPGEYNTFVGGGFERSQVASMFKFCAVSKFEPRKGWDALFKAFFDAFDVRSGVSLHVRTYLTDAQQIKGAWSTVDSKAISQYIAFEYGRRKQMPPLEVITLHLTDEEMAGFFKGCDAFVLPSRGEGWGLPVLQAMAMGLPTITTNGSGMLAFATPDTAILVDADLQRVPEAARKIYKLPYATEWFEPRHDALVAALKQVHAMSPEERRALGARARAHAVKNFAPSVVADTIARRVAEHEQRVRAKWAAQGPPPLQGGSELRRWNCTATFALTP